MPRYEFIRDYGQYSEGDIFEGSFFDAEEFLLHGAAVELAGASIEVPVMEEPEEVFEEDEVEKEGAEEVELESLTVPELRAMAKEMGAVGFSSMKKDELIALLEA